MQNKDDPNNLCMDLNKILLRLAASLHAPRLVLSPRLKLPQDACEPAVSVCAEAMFLSETCPPPAPDLVFGILTHGDLSCVDVYCSAALQLNFYYF